MPETKKRQINAAGTRSQPLRMQTKGRHGQVTFERMKSASKSDLQEFTVVSMFSGCGGMDLGFIGGFEVFGCHCSRLPYRIIWANEHNRPVTDVMTSGRICLWKHGLRSFQRSVRHVKRVYLEPGDYEPLAKGRQSLKINSYGGDS